MGNAFLTPVGMNRTTLQHGRTGDSVPHTRGDEPLSNAVFHTHTDAFLTPVGMNRLLGLIE